MSFHMKCKSIAAAMSVGLVIFLLYDGLWGVAIVVALWSISWFAMWIYIDKHTEKRNARNHQS